MSSLCLGGCSFGDTLALDWGSDLHSRSNRRLLASAGAFRRVESAAGLPRLDLLFVVRGSFAFSRSCGLDKGYGLLCGKRVVEEEAASLGDAGEASDSAGGSVDLPCSCCPCHFCDGSMCASFESIRQGRVGAGEVKSRRSSSSLPDKVLSERIQKAQVCRML